VGLALIKLGTTLDVAIATKNCLLSISSAQFPFGGGLATVIGLREYCNLV
jgi:hypothetical protein